MSECKENKLSSVTKVEGEKWWRQCHVPVRNHSRRFILVIMAGLFIKWYINLANLSTINSIWSYLIEHEPKQVLALPLEERHPLLFYNLPTRSSSFKSRAIQPCEPLLLRAPSKRLWEHWFRAFAFIQSPFILCQESKKNTKDPSGKGAGPGWCWCNGKLWIRILSPSLWSFPLL